MKFMILISFFFSLAFAELKVGDPAPTFYAKTLDNRSFFLSDSLERNQRPIVLSFFATWCGPCKTFKPVVIELVEEGYSIEIIDLDEQQDIAAQYRISSSPTMIIEENGIEVDRFIGALPKKQVIQKLID
mgnify:CR=1 FL=1